MGLLSIVGLMIKFMIIEEEYLKAATREGLSFLKIEVFSGLQTCGSMRTKKFIELEADKRDYTCSQIKSWMAKSTT